LTDDRPGEAGASPGAAFDEEALAGERLGHAESDRSDGLDGLVRSFAVAGGVGTAESGGPHGEVRRSTHPTLLAGASATNERKRDKELRRVHGQEGIEVVADSGELSGLDKGRSKPNLDPPRADLRMDDAANLAVGIEDFGVAAATWGCRPGPDVARRDGEVDPGSEVGGDCPAGGCDVIAPASHAAVQTHPP
jgi:hypothetical protein